jgi:hypothetical protein
MIGDSPEVSGSLELQPVGSFSNSTGSSVTNQQV